jgi:hypothetical protein
MTENDVTKWAWPMQLARLLCSIPSLFGAAYIVQHVLRSPQRRRRAFHRILLIMSGMDFIFAATSVFSSTITPQDNDVPYRTLPSSFGTWTTCQVFAFFQHGASLSSVLYNGSLSLYYVLTIRHGWTDWRIQNHHSTRTPLGGCCSKVCAVEKLLHAVPLMVGWGLAITALPLNLYNPTFVGCGTYLLYTFEEKV